MKYLISTLSLLIAKVIAKDRKLGNNEWVHICLSRGNRRKALAGRYVTDETYLIGYFTDEEKACLVRNNRHIKPTSVKRLIDFTIEDALNEYQDGFYCICGDGKIQCLTNDIETYYGGRINKCNL